VMMIVAASTVLGVGDAFPLLAGFTNQCVAM